MPDAATIQRSIAIVSSQPKKDTLRTGSEDTGSFRTA
jgi:hypothetical protein